MLTNMNLVDTGNSNLDDVNFCLRSGDDIDDDWLARMTLLLEKSFGKWPLFELSLSPAEYLRWQIEGPAGETSMMTIGEEDSDLVSMNVVLRRSYLLYGQPIEVIDCTNSCVHPDHRGRGIFSARRAFQKSHFGNRFRVEIGFTQHPAILHHWKSGSQHPPANALQLLARPLKLGTPIIAEYGKGGMRRLVDPMAAFALWGLSRATSCLYQRWVPPYQRRSVVVLERFDERADRLFERASTQFDFIQVRNQHHLNWRYCDIRGGGFTVLGIEEGDALLGYLALKISRNRCYIADILSLPQRLDVVCRLLEEAVQRTKGCAQVMICWLPRHHPYVQLLGGLGFINVRRPISIGIRRLALSQLEERVFRDPQGALHLMQGDSDTV
jgi:hypothetical protein